ncbi:hypothetical protein MKQ70_01845 [Chitinophaga sedimenti]|nr:hypothetical protein [Chitinophaga sedimenti]MCK7553813.1 hypothetical protein [Chitinophaga sedimenti]
MDIDTQAAGAAFSFEERYVRVGFGVLGRYTQVERIGLQYEALLRDFEMIDLVVFTGIQHAVPVRGRCLPKCTS